MNGYDRRRTASSVTLEEEHPMRNSILELGIMLVANLNKLKRFSANSHPYVHISQNNKQWESSVGKNMYSNYVWGEFFELDLDYSQDFNLVLYNKDELGENSIISGFIISPLVLLDCTSQVWLRLEDKTELSCLTPNLIASESCKDPVLLIQVRCINIERELSYSLKIENHKNLIDGENAFTYYEAKVLRNDGHSWKCDLRYSDVLILRKKMIKILPDLKKIKFPRKTYFNWLGSIWKRFSKFYLLTINLRIKLIEEFLNSVLLNYKHIKCDDLVSLLRIADN